MRGNLPEELTSFVGRDDELADLGALIAERRLITLTGVGGGGKTRLATALGAQVAKEWPDGVWLVDLGSVADPVLIPLVVASTLGVLIEPSSDQELALAKRLQGRRMLLCLDTCEHVLGAASNLAETLLRRCATVAVLATSREPLGIAGETVWRVPSLRPPDAARLFGERAQLADPRFDLDASRDDVAAVCSQVDHLPLAVELAAAWVRVLTPSQIAAGLSDSFAMLAGGPRSAAPRHQTLLASMGWSHALLAAHGSAPATPTRERARSTWARADPVAQSAGSMPNCAGSCEHRCPS